MKIGDKVRISDKKHAGFNIVGEIKRDNTSFGGFEVNLPDGWVSFVDEDQLELIEELETEPTVKRVEYYEVVLQGQKFTLDRHDFSKLRKTLMDTKIPL
jgi:hypothetical protein